jgi:tRNA pseudouridine38-40 synthase
MVRNIVGTLAVVGRGAADPPWVAGVLAGADRRSAGMTAPAGGLYLLAVDYGEALPAESLATDHELSPLGIPIA